MEIIQDDLQQKGFFWVEALKPQWGEVPSQNSLEGIWGQLRLRLVAGSPLFVGSGEIGVDGEGRTYFQFARCYDRYIIPGSSLKGAVRGLAELLSPSCMAVVDDRSYRKRCFATKQRPPLSLCPACGIFGAPGYYGRVGIEDAPVDKGFTRLIEQIDHRTEARRFGPSPDRERAFSYRKLYSRDPAQQTWYREKERLEVLRGVTAEVLLYFRQLREWELGLLTLSLGIAPEHEFAFKLGGGKNRGMGLVKLQFLEGAYSPGRGWFLGHWKQVTREILKSWLEAYRVKARSWNSGLWEKIKQVVNKLQEVYEEKK